MPEQTELSCVSCETSFDPAPNGGFCPDCDTPHPDYEAPADDGTEADEADGDDTESVAEITDGGGNLITDDEDATDTDADDAAEPTDADETDDTDDEPASAACPSCESTVDASAAFCPNCGENLESEDESEDETEDDEPAELSACPDCGESIDDESFCPGCGTDLDAIRESGGVDEAAEDGDDEPEPETDQGADDADDVPQEVTLVIDGEPYTFEDGDVFGRRDEAWLSDLVAASGGREDARYLSSEHLEFSIEDDGVYVTDVSTNGTKRNGTPMDGSKERLEDGDTLELADRAEIDVEL